MFPWESHSSKRGQGCTSVAKVTWFQLWKLKKVEPRAWLKNVNINIIITNGYLWILFDKCGFEPGLGLRHVQLTPTTFSPIPLLGFDARRQCSGQGLQFTVAPQHTDCTAVNCPNFSWPQTAWRILICGKQQIASLLVEQLKPFFWGLVFNTWDVQFRMWWVESEILEKKATFDEMPC